MVGGGCNLPERTTVNLASSHSGACIRASGHPQPWSGVTWTRAACATPPPGLGPTWGPESRTDPPSHPQAGLPEPHLPLRTGC